MFIGESKRIQVLKNELERSASNPLPVLITGESGTGKEISAAYLYRKSHRRGPFIPVNCTTLTESLADSELFGYAESAFTGASKSKVGLCESANGGVLFLDEVGDLPLGVQAKLLRFLDSGQIRRVGDTRVLAVDVKVVSATNRDLSDEIRNGRFRADLFYRLSTLQVRTPSLDEHPEDIPALVEHFIRESGLAVQCSPAALALLQRLHYPGNVRELRNIVLQSACTAENGIIEPRHIQGTQETRTPNGATLQTTIHEMQYAFIRQRLMDNLGNITRTAKTLGIHRNTLSRLLHKRPIKIPS